MKILDFLDNVFPLTSPRRLFNSKVLGAVLIAYWRAAFKRTEAFTGGVL